MNEIPWKEYPLEFEHEGVTLKGIIRYWSKDWSVVLEEPTQARTFGGHMMYMVPMSYCTPMDFKGHETPKRRLNLAEGEAQEKLTELYEEYKDQPQEGYETILCRSFWEELEAAARPVSEQRVSKQRKDFKKKRRSGAINDLQLHAALTKLRIDRRELKNQAQKLIRKIVVNNSKREFHEENFDALFWHFGL